MSDRDLSDLERLIVELEEKLESDEEYSSSDEFEKKYQIIIEKETILDDIIVSPPNSASEKQFDRYDQLRRHFQSCRARIRRIEDDTDINTGNDDSWMSDDD
jgi:hypothetical protein